MAVAAAAVGYRIAIDVVDGLRGPSYFIICLSRHPCAVSSRIHKSHVTRASDVLVMMLVKRVTTLLWGCGPVRLHGSGETS